MKSIVNFARLILGSPLFCLGVFLQFISLVIMGIDNVTKMQKSLADIPDKI